MKMNKEKFLKSELGSGMIECVKYWDYCILKFGNLFEEVGLFDDAQNGRPQNQAGNQRADHLRHTEAFGEQSQNFGGQQYQRNIQ